MLLLPLYAFAGWHRDLLQQLRKYRQTGKGQDTQAGTLLHCVGNNLQGACCRINSKSRGNTKFPSVLQEMGILYAPVTDAGTYFSIQMLLNGKREGMTKLNGRSSRDAALLAGVVSRGLSWSSVQPLPSLAPAPGPHIVLTIHLNLLHYQQVQTTEFIGLCQ